MKTLWQRTTYLFWRYPIFWLPLIVADLLGFSIRQLQKTLNYNIVLWVVQHAHHSVLGNAPDPSDQYAITTKASLLTAPFTWSAEFIYVCLYVVALLVTAAFIRSLAETSTIHLRAALSNCMQRSKDILWFSFKMMLLVALALPLFASCLWLLSLTKMPVLSQTIIVTMIFYTAIAYLMAPSGIALLRPKFASSLSPEARHESRKAAIIAALASAILGFIQQAATKSVYGSHLWITFLMTVSSLLIALPFIPLFIALALIANPSESSLDSESPGESPNLELPNPI